MLSSSQNAELIAERGSNWGSSTLPWTLSTTAHAALLLGLAAFYWTHDRFSFPIGDRGGLSVTVVTAGDSADGSGADGDGADLAGLAKEFAAGEYFDDEPPAIAPAPAELPERGESTSNRAGGLDALLNEKPAVSLAGVVPASGLKSPSTAGTGHDGEAVGSASSHASRPSGTGGSGGGLRGGWARTSVFGAIGEGRKFVYVFDRSGSMEGHGGAPLAAAKAELIGSLKDLGQTQQFQIIFYNEHPRVFTPSGTPGRLVFGTEQNRYLAQKFIGSITADGATRHEEALEMAIRMAPDVIFFLTDADEPRLTTKQLLHVAQRNPGTTINAIEFGYGAQTDPDNFLVKLARQNGGTHVYVDVSRLSTARR